MRKTLTDRTLKALKPAPEGKHVDYWDTMVPGLGVRVSDTGRRTFVLMTRYPGSKNPARRAMGEYGAISLDTARQTARHWLDMIRQGKDPAIERERQRAAEIERQENTFAAVAADFIREKLPAERKGEEVARDLQRVFVTAWGKRPITDISPLEVRKIVKQYADAGKPAQAHNLLGYARRLFNWAIDQHVYGIQASPCDRLKPRAIIGERLMRNRILSDAELRAVWQATAELEYPYGPLFRLLTLTGQRKSEVAEAQWSEIDLAKKLWIIPATRMKSGAAHVVPLSDDAVTLLKGLPRFNGGDFLFSTTFGKKPVNGFSKGKARLDTKMLAILQKQDAAAELADFVIHDLRRTVRTGLSGIPGISDLVRELVIAHTKPGLHRVYDQFSYADEKRQALDAWAMRLRSIIEPPPANVIEMPRVTA